MLLHLPLLFMYMNYGLKQGGFLGYDSAFLHRGLAGPSCRPCASRHGLACPSRPYRLGLACQSHLRTPLSVASHLAHLYQAAVEAGHILQTQTPDKQLSVETTLGATYGYF